MEHVGGRAYEVTACCGKRGGVGCYRADMRVCVTAAEKKRGGKGGRGEGGGEQAEIRRRNVRCEGCYVASARQERKGKLERRRGEGRGGGCGGVLRMAYTR